MYYAVYVMGGHEEETIRTINAKLDQGIAGFHEVFSPMREVVRKDRDGKTIARKKILFPGYIFVDTVTPKKFAVALYNIPQYAKLLGRDDSTGDFVPLTDEECLLIDTLCGKDVERLLKTSFVSIKEGKHVEVITGPLQGMEGRISRVDLHRHVCYLPVTILGKKTEIEFPINFVRLDGKE